MPYQRGQRQSRRSVDFIVSSFSKLMKSRDYCQLTVANISEHAQVGRSTFYRHFNSKLDILVHLHRGYFCGVYQGYRQPADWFSELPPAGLARCLQRFVSGSRLRSSVWHQLGADRDQAQRRIEEAMAEVLKDQLHQSFVASQFALPMEELAWSMNAVVRAQLARWKLADHSLSADEMAKRCHLLLKALLQGAMRSQSQTN